MKFNTLTYQNPSIQIPFVMTVNHGVLGSSPRGGA
jgi:hypothetical protein